MTIVRRAGAVYFRIKRNEYEIWNFYKSIYCCIVLSPDILLEGRWREGVLLGL